VRDNTATKLDKGPQGVDQRTLTGESSRLIVETIRRAVWGSHPPTANSRPAHATGLFLRGRFTSSDRETPFTSDLFTGPPSTVVARLSPTLAKAGGTSFDIHGIAVRIQTGDNEANLTDLVAMNSQPFMFRSADGFAAFVGSMRGGTRDRLTGLGMFGLSALAGDASVHGMANAVRAAVTANRPLSGRTYWGIHTFFADRSSPSDVASVVRVPYRYRLQLTTGGPAGSHPSGRGILSQYRDIAAQVASGKPLYVSVWFDLPWRWERLTDWDSVPGRTRDDIINPLAVWKNTTAVPMGTIVLDEVVDAEALSGGDASQECEMLAFDPTRLTDGLHASEDPLLRARSEIYAESHMRRA
jgi:catalase